MKHIEDDIDNEVLEEEIDLQYEGKVKGDKVVLIFIGIEELIYNCGNCPNMNTESKETNEESDTSEGLEVMHRQASLDPGMQ